MEENTCSAKIPGPLLARMLHERYRGHGTVGGILYGKTVSRTVTEITDEKHVDLTKSFIYIQDYQPRSSAELLKNNAGTKAWEDGCDPISIGFFKVRKSTAQMSVLEKSVQRRLKKSLKPNEYGVMLLITCQVSEAQPSLLWKIAAYVLHENSFMPIHIEVSNLHGSLSASYTSCPRPLHSTFASNSVLHSFEASLTGVDGEVVIVQLTRKATEDLLDKLNSAYAALHKNEAILENLLAERTHLMNICDTL